MTPLIEKGVEVIIPAGGLPMLLFSREKEFKVGNVLILNGLNVVCKLAELAIKLKKIDGTHVSRAALFAKASPQVLEEFLSDF